MTLLDAFLGMDSVELQRELRAMLGDSHVNRQVTYRRAGENVVQFTTGTSVPSSVSKVVSAIGGPTQDKLSGAWSVGTRTYLVLSEELQVPKPAIVPERGDWIEESDGSHWRVEETDRGEFGSLLYYVLKTRSI